MNIVPAIIEKDYYVTLLLKEITEQCPEIIFKGGTSLSKCHKIISRFSEDIDIGLNADKATEAMRKNLKQCIINSIQRLGFELDNPEQIYTRTYYNKYQIKYPINDTIVFIKPYLYIETAVFMKPFPFDELLADTYIYRFLKAQKQDKIIEEYNLQPFKVKTQTLERTFIDKLFALGDYYILNKSTSYSRHLYDLYEIFPSINFDDKFVTLFNEVKAIRSQDKDCPSAKPNQNLTELLKEIYKTDYFKKDYENITLQLLFENVPYSTVKNCLKNIIEHLSEIFE